MLNQLRVWLIVAVLTASSAVVRAQDWGVVANISATMGVTGGRLCYGEASRGDIGCPADAPTVSGSTITGTFVGDGSGLTGVTATGDRIVSGTGVAYIVSDGTVTINGRLEIVTGTEVVAVGAAAGKYYSGTNIVALGSAAGAYSSGSSVVLVGKSAGYNNSGSAVVAIGSFAGRYNTSNYLTAVGHAAGTSNTGNTVTALGYYAGASNTFSNVTLLGSNVYTADKGNQVVLGNGSVVEVSTSGIYVGKGVSTTGGISGTTGYFSGNVGMGAASPSSTLHVVNSLATTGTGSTTLTLGTPWAGTANGYISYVNASGGGGNMYIGSNGSGAGYGGVYVNSAGSFQVNTTSQGTYGIIATGGGSGTGPYLGRVGINQPYYGTLRGLYVSGSVAIGNANFTNPSTTLDVTGAIRMAMDTSTTMNTCDTDRAGAIRYTSGKFQVCYGTGGWANLTDASSTLATVDRITSGTAQVIANGGSGYVSLTSGVSTWGYLGVSQTYLGATNFGGKVGIGTVTPAAALEVSGTVSASAIQLADSPAITCGPATYGTTKFVNGRPYYCRP